VGPTVSAKNKAAHRYDLLSDEEFTELMRERYGDAIANIVGVDKPPARRRKGWPANRVDVRGNPENPDADPSAVDQRHHQARQEKGT
jgi:hypothetical protein